MGTGDGTFNEFMVQVVTVWARVLPTVAVLFALILLDIGTGVIAAVITDSVSSETSHAGMMKKVQEILAVALGLLIELLYPTVPWGSIIAGFLCLTEAISITENLVDSGVQLPDGVVSTLKHLRKSGKREQFNVPGRDTVSIVPVVTDVDEYEEAGDTQ